MLIYKVETIQCTCPCVLLGSVTPVKYLVTAFENRESYLNRTLNTALLFCLQALLLYQVWYEDSRRLRWKSPQQNQSPWYEVGCWLCWKLGVDPGPVCPDLQQECSAVRQPSTTSHPRPCLTNHYTRIHLFLFCTSQTGSGKIKLPTYFIIFFLYVCLQGSRASLAPLFWKLLPIFLFADNISTTDTKALTLQFLFCAYYFFLKRKKREKIII